MREPKLGLCNPPYPRYLFVGQDEGDSGACWYELNENKNRIYVTERAIAGYLTGIRLEERDMGKFGMKWKLDLLLSADQPFVIRTGVDTIFARGVILGLNALAVEDALNLTEPIMIVVAPSKQEKKVVFGSVYVEATGRRVKYEWEKDAELVPLIRHLQTFVGDGGGHDDSEVEEESHGSPAPDNRSNYRDAQPRTERPAGLANADVLKELKRVGANVGYVTDEDPPLLDIDQLNAECHKHFGYCKTIEDLKTGDAIEFRKILMSA